ncbi:MAG: trehalose-phosphatase [Candidatus Binataceae bacterium]
MPRSSSTPVPLPQGLLNDLLSRGRLLLFLDYDGTLAPIVNDPKNAWPVPKARKALALLASHRDRLGIAIVSGRDLPELHRLLGIDGGIYLAGVHGLEIEDPGGQLATAQGVEHALNEIGRVRKWLEHNISPDNGFVIEDKRFSIALHYRNAERAVARRAAGEFTRFVASETDGLILKRGKMVIEAAPVAADKGEAVRQIMGRFAPGFTPVYFGDDLTDEDAFRALQGRGITVIVGDIGPTAAEYWVESPQAVGDMLAGMAATLDAANPPQ